MLNDIELTQCVARLGSRLQQQGRLLVTAESCTGGWVGKALTDVPGSSAWYAGGIVAYSNLLKHRLLTVSLDTLSLYGAVSEATVREMAIGALRVMDAQVAVAVSGIAGPDGAGPGKPVGCVWFAWAYLVDGEPMVSARMHRLIGDREMVRRGAVSIAISELETVI